MTYICRIQMGLTEGVIISEAENEMEAEKMATEHTAALGNDLSLFSIVETHEIMIHQKNCEVCAGARARTH